MGDKDKEEVYENLVAMYNKLNLNLMESGKNETTKIQNMAYLGTAELEEKIGDMNQYKNVVKDVYVVEEYDFKNDKTFLKYYIDDMLLSVKYNNEIIETEDCKRRFKNIDSIRDLVEQMEEEVEKLNENSLNNLEEERTGKIASSLGVDVKELEEIHEFDIDKKSKEKVGEQIEEEENENINNINTRENVDLNQVFEEVTLRKVLGLSGDYVKIAIVNTSDIKNNKDNKQNGKYAFVGIKNNGDISVLDGNILVPDNQEGKNPIKEDTTIDTDGTVDKEQNLVSYKVVGKKNVYLGIGYDESHGLEVKIAQREIGGEEDIEYELLTNRQTSFQEDSDARNFRRDRSEGMYKANNTLERGKEHEDELEEGSDNVKAEDIDNIKGNETHTHIIVDGKEVTLKELATKWGYYNNGKPDEEKARKTFEEYKDNNPDLSDEDVIQKVSDDLYDEYPGPNRQR